MGKAKGPLPVPEKTYTSWSDLLAVNKVVDPYFPTFDLQVPDQYRIAVWLQKFKQEEKSGKLPEAGRAYSHRPVADNAALCHLVTGSFS
jgi:hypothetical protein